MRTFNTEGIVIRRTNVGEAGRIITIFTKRYGKLSLKAIGVRRITSKRASHIELLNHSIFSVHNGKGMPILTEVVMQDDFSKIKDNLTKIAFAYHVCELIDGLCPENQELPMIFDLFKTTLHRMEDEEDIFRLIHEFEIELLSQLGYFNKLELPINFNSATFIENILERKLKSKNLLSKFS